MTRLPSSSRGEPRKQTGQCSAAVGGGLADVLGCWPADSRRRRRGLLIGVVPAGLATGIALVLVAVKGYHVALAAGTSGRYAAGATVTGAFMTAAPLGW
jgi:hypothetical protein